VSRKKESAMVYNPNKVVACVKVGGRVLREDGDSVTLPFGSEYSVLVKNLNPVRIKCKVSIDGTDATDGLWLIVNPNDDLELERFIHNANLEAGNRFKFIERTSEIEEHRGIKAEDGLIRIEFQVEKRTVVDEVIHRTHHTYIDDYDYWPRPCWPRRRRWDDTFFKSATLSRVSGSSEGNSPIRTMGMKGLCRSAETLETSCDAKSDSIGYNSFEFPNDKGITVPGSESSQKFTWGSSFETGPSEVIVLKLRGAVAGRIAKKAITVEMKPKCETCGRVNKTTSKFCANCGTALSLI